MPRDIEIEVLQKAKTNLAVLVRSSVTDKEAWVPLSKISDYCEDEQGNFTSIFLPEWMAVEKELF